LIDHGFQAFNAGRLSEACRIFSDKMLHPKNDTTIGLTVAGAMTPAGDPPAAAGPALAGEHAATHSARQSASLGHVAIDQTEHHG